jgi:hypothetical protein
LVLSHPGVPPCGLVGRMPLGSTVKAALSRSSGDGAPPQLPSLPPIPPIGGAHASPQRRRERQERVQTQKVRRTTTHTTLPRHRLSQHPGPLLLALPFSLLPCSATFASSIRAALGIALSYPSGNRCTVARTHTVTGPRHTSSCQDTNVRGPLFPLLANAARPIKVRCSMTACKHIAASFRTRTQPEVAP